MLSLSTCWNSNRHENGEGIVQEAQKLGFEYIELSHGLKVTHLPGIFRLVAAGEIKISSIHNFCPSPVEVLLDAPDAYEFTSSQANERDRALDLTEKTIETASQLGANRVVVHLGSTHLKTSAGTELLEAMTLEGKIYSRSYIKEKLALVELRQKASQQYLDRACTALDALLPTCEHYQVALAIETRSHFEQVPDETEMSMLMDRYNGCRWIGFWHDFGHVQRKANLGLLNHAEQLSLLAPRLLGCHVHDVEWPLRDHRVPLSTGGVDFVNLLPLVPPNIPLVWELSSSQKQSQVRDKLAAWKNQFSITTTA